MSDKKTFVVSDETTNSYGFRVKTAGINLDRFKKNPVMLNMHDRAQVLGGWENLRIEGTQLLADPVWDEEDEAAMKVKGKVDRGFIKGSSIGIEPIKTTYNDKDDTIEVTESILKEISIASVPSNENALALYDKDGTIMNKEQLIALSDSSKTNNTNLTDMKNLKILAKVLNLTDGATEDDVTLAVQTLAETNVTLSDANKALKTANEKLTGENATLKDASKDVTKNLAIVLVDGAVAANKIVAAERDTYIELAEANYDGVKKLLDAKKPFKGILKTITEGGNPAGGDGADLAFADETKSFKWDDFFKAGRTKELQDKDPERFNALYKAKFNKEYKG